MRSAATTTLITILAVGAIGCVFGFRGELEFGNEASLSNVETIQLHLPPTELILAGSAERTFMDWSGTWVSLGGSGDDAIETARAWSRLVEPHRSALKEMILRVVAESSGESRRAAR